MTSEESSNRVKPSPRCSPLTVVREERPDPTDYQFPFDSLPPADVAAAEAIDPLSNTESQLPTLRNKPVMTKNEQKLVLDGIRIREASIIISSDDEDLSAIRTTRLVKRKAPVTSGHEDSLTSRKKPRLISTKAFDHQQSNVKRDQPTDTKQRELPGIFLHSRH